MQYTHLLMMAIMENENIWEPVKNGKFVSQFQPDIKTTIWRFERIERKIFRRTMSIIFNQIYIYIYIYTHTHTHACTHTHTHIYIYIYIHIYVCVWLKWTDSSLLLISCLICSSLRMSLLILRLNGFWKAPYFPQEFTVPGG